MRARLVYVVSRHPPESTYTHVSHAQSFIIEITVVGGGGGSGGGFARTNLTLSMRVSHSQASNNFPTPS